MGKDLKGKELGNGLVQRKDGKYAARFVSKCLIIWKTFATRAIEAGMKPKTLQEILGHANIGITMNLYVHITEEEKEKEIKKFEQAFSISS